MQTPIPGAPPRRQAGEQVQNDLEKSVKLRDRGARCVVRPRIRPASSNDQTRRLIRW
jgi:hypothetical protein